MALLHIVKNKRFQIEDKCEMSQEMKDSKFAQMQYVTTFNILSSYKNLKIPSSPKNSNT